MAVASVPLFHLVFQFDFEIGCARRTKRTDDADTCALDVRFVAKNLLAGSGSGGEGLSGAGKKSRSPQPIEEGNRF